MHFEHIVRLTRFLRRYQPELLARQCFAGIGHFEHVAPQDTCERFDAELHAADRSSAQQSAAARIETPEIVIDQRRQPLRHGNVGERLRRRAAGADTGPYVASHGCDEQRHALGAVVQRAHEALVMRHLRRAPGEIGRDLALGERIEHDLFAQSVQAELVPQRAERVIERDHLGQSEARQPHESSRASPTCDVVDELRCRAIAPVQVLGDEQQRAICRVAVEELAHFAQHALGMDSDQLTQQRFADFRCAEPGQLQQPGRRDGAQQRCDGVVVPAKLGQCLEHGVVRLAGAEALHAIAARTGHVAQAGDEMLDQGGLADAGLASHPDHHPTTFARALPGSLQRRQFGRAPDELA